MDGIHDKLRMFDAKVEEVGREHVEGVKAHLEATIQQDSLQSHWQGLEVLFRDRKTPAELRTMKRSFYAGASALLAVMKAKVQAAPDGLSDEEGGDLIADLTAEALGGLIESVLEREE